MNDLITLVEKEKSTVARSLKITTAASILLVVLVLIEVIYIRTTVRQRMGPKSVALLLTDAVYNQIPLVNDAILLKSYETAPIVADQFVEHSLQMLRDIPPVAKANTLELTDTLLSKLEAQGGADAFQQLVLEVYGMVEANKEDFSNDSFVRIAATDLMDEWEKTLEVQVKESGISKTIRKMDTEISVLLATPQKKLTKKQIAQKRMLACTRILFDRLTEEK